MRGRLKVLLISGAIAIAMFAVAALSLAQVGTNSLHSHIKAATTASHGNPNDGKDNCPNDGNAGGGNDGKCQPPGGGYGNPGNPNDGKDNCPNDGNAGKGNDNKGPNGGCRTK